MRKPLLIAVTAIATLFAGLGVRGQTPAPTSGSIKGTVTDAAGAPAAGVFVVVFPAEEARRSGPGSDARVKRVAVTAGRFEVTDLPVGNYQVTFATEAMLADWPSVATLTKLNVNKPMPIRLAVGEEVGLDAVVSVSAGDVTMTSAKMSRTSVEMVPSVLSRGVPSMPPGRGRPAGPPAPTAPGAISGRLTDADGKPVAGVEVRTMRRAIVNGVVQFTNSGASSTTDADGNYRLVNRAAADYVVLAMAYSTDARAGVEQVRRVPPPVATADGKQLGYVTTFHGGALEQTGAMVVSVATDERADINIRLAQRPVWNVTGSVSARIPVVGAPMTFVLSPLDLPDQSGSLRTRRVPVMQDGKFTVPDVPEGEYLASITTYEGWAETRLKVAGRAPDAISFTLRPPMLVSGRVEFQGSTPPPVIPPLGPTMPQYMVELRPAQLTVGAGFNRLPLQPDGTFSTRASGAGPFRLQGIAPAPWVPVSGVVNGVDTLDIPMPFGADARDAVVIFADRQTALLVKVTDDADQPAADVGVVVFSEDLRYWPVRSRRVQLGVTMPGGACALSNFPPSRYFVVATRELKLNDVVTPALIERLKSRALPFELAAGESRSIQVRVR